MTTLEKNSWIDIILGVVFIIFGAVVYVLTLDLPGSTYDPLGPAFMPRALALCSLASAAVILYQGLRKRIAVKKELRGKEHETVAVPMLPFTRHPMIAFSAMVMVFFYILALDLGLSGFRTITVLFVLALGGTLIRAEKAGSPVRKGIFLFLLALALSFGLFYLFTRVFIVDLY